MYSWLFISNYLLVFSFPDFIYSYNWQEGDYAIEVQEIYYQKL